MPNQLSHPGTLINNKLELTDNSTVIVGDFNTLLPAMDRSSKQNSNKETKALNDTLDQMDFIDIFREFHPKAEEYTFFSSAHGTLSRIDHILGHKSGLNWYQNIRTRILLCIFSDHNALKLEINQKKMLEGPEIHGGKRASYQRMNGSVRKLKKN